MKSNKPKLTTNEKKLHKAQKALGEAALGEIQAMTSEKLRERIYQASRAMSEVADELEANTAYRKAKEDKAALEQGKREVFKRQNAVITVAIHTLNERGLGDWQPVS